jgi:A/G-specific adenine glycosylase
MSPATLPRPGLEPSPAFFRRTLLAWYARSGRHDLPWRGGRATPYAILVSEFMLQQTTVATVIPYYDKFLKTFPTVQKLAKANPERVLELWAGLGYYARARNLHAAAQKIVQEFGGQVPDTREGVESLPGVGRYTAGAILSLAFNKPEPVVDGNVVRVLARVYGVQDDVKDRATVERLWAIAWKLVPPDGARAFNSALMDFGATLCRPSGPDCLVCPFFAVCRARLEGRQEEIPWAAAARPRKEVHLVVGLVRRKNKWAMVRRPSGGLYGGLWEFPGTGVSGDQKGEDVLRRFLAGLGLTVRLTGKLETISHILSHRELRLHPWLCEDAGGEDGLSPIPEGGWFSAGEIKSMAVSSLTRRLAARAESAGKSLVRA